MRHLSLALVIAGFGCLGWACASDSPAVPGDGGGGSGARAAGSGGGEGGTGGVGGIGAEGGSGGAGGAGGNGGVCGDGRIDAGEACDDGNLVEGDGCSGACEMEGSCERPLDWQTISNLDESLRRVWSVEDYALPGAKLVGSCGGLGNEVVIRYVPPESGRLAIDNTILPAARLYVRRGSCAPEEMVEEAICRLAGSPLDLAVEAGEAIYIVLDLFEPGETASLELSTRSFPHRQAGEECGAMPDARCAPGLTCDDVDSRGICTENAAPVLHGAALYRGGASGNDLVALFEGEDDNGDVFSIAARVRDADGNAIPWVDGDGDGIFEVQEVPLTPSRALLGSKSFDVAAVRRNYFDTWPQADAAELFLRDTANARTSIDLPILPAPRIAAGGTCDPEVLRDLCEEGMLCVPPSEGGAPICRPLAEARQERCEAAPAVAVGESIQVIIPTTHPDATSAWRAPDACSERTPPAAIAQLPDGLARLHLEEDATNLVIDTGGSAAETILYLLPDCGTTGEVIACNDDANEVQATSQLFFPTLPAGDYLIVVEKRFGERVMLRVWTGTP